MPQDVAARGNDDVRYPSKYEIEKPHGGTKGFMESQGLRYWDDDDSQERRAIVDAMRDQLYEDRLAARREQRESSQQQYRTEMPQNVHSGPRGYDRSWVDPPKQVAYDKRPLPNEQMRYEQERPVERKPGYGNDFVRQRGIHYDRGPIYEQEPTCDPQPTYGRGYDGVRDDLEDAGHDGTFDRRPDHEQVDGYDYAEPGNDYEPQGYDDNAGDEGGLFDDGGYGDDEHFNGDDDGYDDYCDDYNY